MAEPGAVPQARFAALHAGGLGLCPGAKRPAGSRLSEMRKRLNKAQPEPKKAASGAPEGAASVSMDAYA